MLEHKYPVSCGHCNWLGVTRRIATGMVCPKCKHYIRICSAKELQDRLKNCECVKNADTIGEVAKVTVV